MKVLERITIWATHLKHTVSKIIIQKSFNRHPQNFKSDKYVQHVHLRIIQITIQTSNFDRTSNHSFCAVFEFYSFSATLPPRYLFDLRWKLSLPEDQALWASAPIEYIRCYKLHILIDIDRICIHDVLAVYIYTYIYIYTCNYHMRAWYIWILLYLTGMKSGYKREFRATASARCARWWAARSPTSGDMKTSVTSQMVKCSRFFGWW